MGWIDLIKVAELYPQDATPVTFNGKSYAVYDTQQGYSVSENRCTHAGAALCDGYFDGRNIECPLHQGLFDAHTGRALAAPVVRALTMFPCRVKDEWLQIQVASNKETNAD